MARIFYASVLVGALLIVGLAAVYPLPQHERYRSMIDVVPDGGREESFIIEWPRDRVTLPDAAGLTRAGAALLLTGRTGQVASAEVFRLRDMAGNVVGLASRSTSGRSPGVQGTDWMLLLPARGSLFLTQLNSRDVFPQAGGAGLVFAADAPAFWSGANAYRINAGAGKVVGGTGEFGALRGRYDEDWELQEASTGGGATRGRITLTTRVQAEQ